MTIEGITRTCAAQDVAFELLQRNIFPTKYKAWDDLAGKVAREEWRKNQSKPLENIRRYRNHLIHGRLTPSIIGFIPILPVIGFEDQYLDWRKLTDSANHPGFRSGHYATVDKILDHAWKETISYFNNSWEKFLLAQKSQINTDSLKSENPSIPPMTQDTNAAYHPPFSSG